MPFDSGNFIRSLPHQPGVYCMLDEDGNTLYVGKAGDLRKRVGSYFNRGQSHSLKTRAMLAQVGNISVTVTHTENEALILEDNLIKDMRPRYNILFRDDKSYPYIYLSLEQQFPGLRYHRGARRGKGRYFGPFPSAGAVKKTLNLLQRLFLLRSCEDTVFSNRSRPCLQYQIKRCTAPCVGYIDAQVYRTDIEHAMMFLEGRNEQVIESLSGPMQHAAERLDYESAARFRDQISSLRKVQEKQYITGAAGDIDIIACATDASLACVEVFYIRGGLNLGSKTYFPQHGKGSSHAELLSAFLTQTYLKDNVERRIPREILVSDQPNDHVLIEKALSNRAGYSLKIKHKVRGNRAKWLSMAVQNSGLSLKQRLAQTTNYRRRLRELQSALGLEQQIERIECFDISHSHGEAPVASCVVFGTEGSVNKEYRKFNIKNIKAGDDCAAMRQAVKRRYLRLIRAEARLPDLILIDGGKGQTSVAREELEEMQQGRIPVIGVAKGRSRKPGTESLIIAGERRSLRLEESSPALHLIQHIRDESHRFALNAHRQRRSTTRKTSMLQDIEGIGSKRRQHLISHFGGLQGVARAGIDDLSAVPGINKNLARKIYDRLHSSL